MPQPRAILKNAAAALVSVLVLVYIVDWAAVRLRALQPTATRPYETMTVARVLAIPEKNGKTEYQIDELHPEEAITCVHAFFPHSGYKPCWYVKRKAMQPIPM